MTDKNVDVTMYGVKLLLPEKRMQFHVIREKQAVERLMPTLPTDEIVRMISFGGFSSIGFIKRVADEVVIDRLTVSTLAVGAKQAEVLDVLARNGRIKDAEFFVGSVMEMDKRSKKTRKNIRDRAFTLKKICENNGWNAVFCKNHSKVILMDTGKGQYVLETSSNLNENPKFEQFSFERNKTLYEFYDEFFNLLKTEAEA
jgi:hypothetical protein